MSLIDSFLDRSLHFFRPVFLKVKCAYRSPVGLGKMQTLIQ